MTEDEIKRLVQRIYGDMFTNSNFDLADEMFASDFVDHFDDPLPGQPLTGPEAVKWYARYLRTAFPDLRATVEAIVVEGDLFAARAMWTGTHQNMFGFIPPTGKHIRIQAIDMARIANGKLAEHWGGWNYAHILIELGALPTPEGTQ
ncbi:MAG TPA: ester cyclase [Chloroflexota bacterium]